MFTALTLHHRKYISLQVSINTQIKGLSRDGCGHLKCCLNIRNHKLGFFLTELWTEVEEKILEKYSPRSRDRNPGVCKKGKGRCWQLCAGSLCPGAAGRGDACVEWGEDTFPVLWQSEGAGREWGLT